jgi:copper(I)-binding protein
MQHSNVSRIGRGLVLVIGASLLGGMTYVFTIATAGAQHGADHAHQKTAPQSYKVGDLVVTAPWVRATPRGAPVAGGYVAITNNGREPDRLVGGSFAAAGRFEVHEMSMEGGVMRMRPVADGLEIKPGQTVELKPGGVHLMFMGLKEQLKAGDTVMGTLEFAKAGKVEIAYPVRAMGAGGHKHH